MQANTAHESSCILRGSEDGQCAPQPAMQRSPASVSTLESGDEQTLLSARSPGCDGRLSFGMTSKEDAFTELLCKSLAPPADADVDAAASQGEEELGDKPAAACGAGGVGGEQRGAPQALPSVGSFMHGTGECRPCAFFWKQRGCKDGRNCTHCHLCPRGEIKARRSAKNEVERLERQHGRIQEQAQQEELQAKALWEQPLQEPRKVTVFSSLLSPHATATGRPPCLPAEGDKHPLAPEPAEPAPNDLSESVSSAEDAGVDLSGADTQAQLPPWCVSFGSAAHGTGECKPCAWFWKPQGCENGQDCRHCHLCPLGEIRERKRKSRARRAAGVPLPPKGLPLTAPPPPLEPETWGELTDMLPGMQPSESWCEAASAPLGMPTGDGWCEVVSTPPGVAALAPPILPPVADELPSAGSAWHSAGLCRPCAWFWKPRGCGNGADCQHCHICPDGEIKARKKVKMACIRLEENRLKHYSGGWRPPMDVADLPGTPEGLAASVAAAVPQLPMPALPSLGSALHFTGKCKPCAWFWKAQGCHNGQACAHCHLCPQGELQSRMKIKRAAMRLGALVPAAASPDSQRPRFLVQIAPILSK